MNYNIDKQTKFTKLELNHDKLDATLAPELKSTFVTIHTEGTRNLILDLNKVKYVDSSGLSSLLVANRLCTESNGTFVIAKANEHVMKLIKISQLDKVLNILPTVEEAQEFIYMNELENELKNSTQ
ncbi:MAG: STAS domain-containing protein [Microscillaceae bacterium]|nr:STAS domain-containing protein [Microscillaceae bacterium]MDW8460077.1 STAS domain-containing protein [Cytophagales bacterium]